MDVNQAAFDRRNLTESASGEVDDTPLPDKSLVGTAVVDTNSDRFAVCQVGNADLLVERHVPHGAGHRFIIEDFVIRCAGVDSRVIFRIPGSFAVTNDLIRVVNRLRLVFGLGQCGA